jgi:hypothetical protein
MRAEARNSSRWINDSGSEARFVARIWNVRRKFVDRQRSSLRSLFRDSVKSPCRPSVPFRIEGSFPRPDLVGTWRTCVSSSANRARAIRERIFRLLQCVQISALTALNGSLIFKTVPPRENAQRKIQQEKQRAITISIIAQDVVRIRGTCEGFNEGSRASNYLCGGCKIAV